MPSPKEPTPTESVAQAMGHKKQDSHATALPHPQRSGQERTGPEPGGLPNRLLVLMAHTSRYAFRGQARLAQDAGVSRSTISRLLRGRTRPSFELACAVTRALEAHMGRRLDPRELISPDGTYPTASGCALAGCRGCMPDEAYDGDGGLRPEYRGLRPGDWSLSTRPRPDTHQADRRPTASKHVDPRQNDPEKRNHRKEGR